MEKDTQGVPKAWKVIGLETVCNTGKRRGKANVWVLEREIKKRTDVPLTYEREANSSRNGGGRKKRGKWTPGMQARPGFNN